MPMLPTETDIWTVEDLRSYLKIPKPTIYALAQGGRIPAAKVGKHWRFRKGDIDEWLKAQQWNRPLQRRQRKVQELNANA